ncbi:MAG: hypothetical protein SynsKO_03580 [Synoicihabitans sp.]
MNLPTNLAYRTDFIFHRHEGVIEEHADYWVVRTPENPTFWFGNFVLFKQAPDEKTTVSAWLKVHDAVFNGSLNHRIFGWDGEIEGNVKPFLDAGFVTSNGIALKMEALSSQAATNPDVNVRKIETAEAWDDVHQQQMLVDRVDFKYPEDGGVFRGNQIASYRTLSDAGRGNWWGAYDGNKLIGNMGLFFDELKRVGRFQNVSTHPDHRRQRVCTTLLHHIVNHAFHEIGAKELVICTGDDDDNAAIPTYQNFGFKFTAPHYALKRITP